MSYSYGRPKPVAATMNRLPAVLLFLAVALFIAADLLLDFDFNWIDYTVVIIIALFGLKGYIKGFINTVFSLAGYLLGLICAYIFSPKVALLAMQKTSWGKSLSDKLNELIPALSAINTAKVSGPQSAIDIINRNPEFDRAISGNPLLKQFMSAANTAAEAGSLYSESVVTMNDLIVFSVLKILALLVLFVVVKLIVVLIGKLLSSVLNSSAILGTANRSAGMAIGLGIGILICYVIFVFVIPTMGSLNIVKMPETYSRSILLNLLNKLIITG